MTTNLSITSDQQKQYKRFVEDAAERALKEVGLDKDGLQKLIENGDQFQADIVTSIQRLSISNQFAKEEVLSNYGYLSGYTTPKEMTEQTNLLRQLIPGVGYADEQLATRDLPKGAEGYLAILRWEKVAPTYGEAVQRVFDLIKQTRNGEFQNYRKGALGPQYLRQHAKTVKVFRTLGDQQKEHDILVVPAQFGFKHRGRSVRRVREILPSSEFGLGAFAVGIMLLTHPERLQHYDDLWIDCAGDEYAPAADGQFDYAPYFLFSDGRVKFDASDVDFASGVYGSASGFLPQ